jgi:hypothetical protein
LNRWPKEMLGLHKDSNAFLHYLPSAEYSKRRKVLKRPGRQ